MEQITNMPLISIVTVCFNSEKTIRRTIESVLNQTYTNIEYILVDGNSTDSTVAIIEEYTTLFAERGMQYRWVSEPDQGIYDAMNKGIKMTTGEWIGIINSDDWYELDACENIVNCSHGDYDLMFGIVRFWNSNNISFVKQNSFDVICRETIMHPGVFARKKVYTEVGLFDTSFKIAADYDFFVRCYSLNISSRMLMKVIANFSLGGVSNTNPFLSAVESLFIQRKYKFLSNYQFFKKRIKLKITMLLRMIMQ